tara:strand:- start:850 stop:2130 length:1281 start_codon:yes stop_codon:yes gene_type:complete
MAHEIVMPKMGESIVEGTILEWKKDIGDLIGKDETLLEISTDKVDSEIPSPVEGTLIKILFNKNDVVEVGKVIALVGEKGEKIEDEKDDKKESIKEESLEDDLLKGSKEIELDLSKNTNNQIKRRNFKGERFYSPLVKKISQKENISLKDLDSIVGTGLSGRVSKGDVIKYLEDRLDSGARAFSEEEIVNSTKSVQDMSHIQKLVAKHMKESVKTSPHVYSSVEVDVTDIVAFVAKNKNEFFEKYNNKLTYTPIFLEACVESLKEFPLINSSVVGEKISYHQNINIGVAVALEDDSLIVPVIHRAEEKNFLGLLRSVSELALNARKGKLFPEDIQNSTFTLTNPGVFGSSFGMAIINQPNVAILSVGAVEKKPAVKETDFGDAIFIRSIMHLTLGYDHRIINGAYGSRFLVNIKNYLENFNPNNKI